MYCSTSASRAAISMRRAPSRATSSRGRHGAFGRLAVVFARRVEYLQHWVVSPSPRPASQGGFCCSRGRIRHLSHAPIHNIWLYLAVESSPRQHRLVLGSPGSGKTIVLLHRARHLIDAFKTPPERCRLFVFTNALKAYIRAALRDLALPDDCVMFFDAWCGEYYLSASPAPRGGSASVPRTAKTPCFWSGSGTWNGGGK